MLFYFVRHGETHANRSGLLAGSGHDHPLNEFGRAQASELAKAWSSLVMQPVHRLVVSSMTRTRETASYLSSALGLEMNIEPDFREWHLGEWEGQTWEQYGSLLLGEGEPRGGESRKEFYARVERAWRRHHSDDQPYVIVAHGAVWLAMQDTLNIPRFKISNCNLIRVKFEGGQWTAENLNCR